ncbi:hypothetical protein AHAS_Ahas04G0249800 [Arachis hypogaea]
MILNKQYRCIHSASCQCTKGHISEDVIFLLFHNLNWNPKLIATFSCVCKWFDDLAKRVLWKEFCRTRAPRMIRDLQSGVSHIVDGNWRALGKLLIYCTGCTHGTLFGQIGIPGHFVYQTRFSRTSGKSFLLRRCRSDVLKMLINKAAELHPTQVCIYCKAKLWNMRQARMIPHSASSWLGSYEDGVEYYVCLNGHMLGTCTLLPLSDSEELSSSEEE